MPGHAPCLLGDTILLQNMLQTQVNSVPIPMPIKVEQLSDLVKSWLRGLGFEPGVVLQTAAQTGAPPLPAIHSCPDIGCPHTRAQNLALTADCVMLHPCMHQR